MISGRRVTKRYRGKLETVIEDLLSRGIFTSVTDLARKLRRFITKYNERAKPLRWAYVDPSRRIA